MTELAVILAAGLGTRLAAVTDGGPKALVAVAGRPILGRLLDGCAAAGIGEALVVTGHGAPAIEAYLASGPAPLAVTTVFNPGYAASGNARSLACALRCIGAHSFVKLDGDLVVTPALLRALAEKSESVLACDRRRELDGEAMKVAIEGGLVTAIGKDLAVAEAESLGLERIAAGDVSSLLAALEAADGYYEDAYQGLLSRGFRLAAHEVSEPWAEIDDEADLRRAESQSW